MDDGFASAGLSLPRDPYSWAESWAWPAIERGEISSPAGLVLLRLAAHANRDGIAWPSARTLARMVGRDERRVRVALGQIRDLGYIDGTPTPGRVTSWRLVTDEDEQHQLRTRPPQLNAVQTLNQPSTNCGATADPSAYEGEGKDLTPLSPHVVGRRGEREGGELIQFNPRALVRLRKVGS